MGNSVSAHLLPAVRTGNANGIKQLVKQGADINILFEDEKTALHIAAEEGKNDIIELLMTLSPSLSVKSADKHKYTALHSAVYMGHASTTSLLIDKGSDLNAADADGHTPLHWAVKRNHLSCAEILLRRGTDLTLRNNRGESALDLASKIKPRSRRPAFIDLIKKYQNGAVDANIPTLAETARVQRLFFLCKIWGSVKYLHPFLLHKDIDWDSALMRAIDPVNKSTNGVELASAIQVMLAALGDPNTRAVAKVGTSGKKKAPETAPAQPEESEQPLFHALGQEHGVVVLTDHVKFTDFSKVKKFAEIFSEARSKCKGVVFDVRSMEPETVHNQFLKYMFCEAFKIFLEESLQLPAIRTRMSRGHPHEWNRQESDLYFEGSFTSDAEGLFPPPLSSAEQQNSVRVIFIINQGTPHWLIDIAASLQSQERAFVIAEAAEPADLLPEHGVPVVTLDDPEVTAYIRTGERINFNNTLGFKPDKVVAEAAGNKPVSRAEAARVYGESQLITEAVSIFSSLPDFASKVPRPQASTYSKRIVEKDYNVDSLTNETRLLSLFKYWNIVRFFYPYKDLIGVSWDNILLEYISKMEQAATPLDYSLLVAELVARLRDTHGYASSPILNDFIGTHVPQISIQNIEGRTIVTHIAPTIAAESGIHVGDQILTVNGVDVDEARKKLSKYLPASTHQAQEWRIDQRLLAGAPSSTVTLGIRLRSSASTSAASTAAAPAPAVAETPAVAATPAAAEASTTPAEESAPAASAAAAAAVEATVAPVSTPAAQNPADSLPSSQLSDSTSSPITNPQVAIVTLLRVTLPNLTPVSAVSPVAPVFGVVEQGIGYVDTLRLTAPDIDKALDAVKDQPCLIIDVRGFPHDTLLKMVLRLTKTRTTVAHSHTPLLIGTNSLHAPQIYESLAVSPPSVGEPSFDYSGKIVLLINERTASIAEQHILYLESICEGICGGIACVGSSTNGALGKMTNVKLPGDIFIGISGVGIKDKSGGVVQRSGIRPKIHVVPTISGILEGKDEVYERALSYCRSYLKGPQSPQATRVRMIADEEDQKWDD